MIDIIALARKPKFGSRNSSERSDPNASTQGDTPDEGDASDARDSLTDEPKDEYSKVEESARNDIAEILGVQEHDRPKFDSAMEDLIESCAKRAMSSED